MAGVREVLTASAARWPDRTAVLDDKGAITFADLQREVEALETRLRDLGVRPRQGVGVIARNGRDFLVAVFAGLGVGATVMRISPQLKPAELTELLQAAPLRLLLSDGWGADEAGVRHAASRGCRVRGHLRHGSGPELPGDAEPLDDVWRASLRHEAPTDALVPRVAAGTPSEGRDGSATSSDASQRTAATELKPPKSSSVVHGLAASCSQLLPSTTNL
jgi:acyl-CoA synthetase (AMP-forming)/AMP-acid ligase II